MSKGIKLSEKYGVNPTIPVCFFCGEQKNEIALLGQIGDRRKGEDIEAPKFCVMDYVPCDCCREKFAKGKLLIEVTTTQPKDRRPTISKDVYPTGRFVVVKKEAIEMEGDKFLVIEDEFKPMFDGII